MPQLSIGNLLFAMQFGATGALFAPQVPVGLGVVNDPVRSASTVFCMDWHFAPGAMSRRQRGECHSPAQPSWRLDRTTRVKRCCVCIASEYPNSTLLTLPEVQPCPT